MLKILQRSKSFAIGSMVKKYEVRIRPNSIRSLMLKFPIVLLGIFFLLQGIDISKDYATLFGIALRDYVPALSTLLNPIHQTIIILFLISTLITALFRKIILPNYAYVFSLLLFVFIATGMFVGIMSGNELRLVMLESSNWLIYISLPAFISISAVSGNTWKTLYKILILYIAIVLIKILLCFIIDFSLNVSYLKVIVRGNIFLMPLFFLTLSFALIIRKRIYWIMMVIAFVALIVTGMKGFYLGISVGIIYFILLMKKNHHRRMLNSMILIALICLISVAVFRIITQVTYTNLLGLWGNTLMNGIEFRMKSAGLLLSTFLESPVWGKGFGFVLYNFEGYEEGLSKPYLQEIEWINFLAKTGLIGIGALMASFYMILRWMKHVLHNAGKKDKAILIGLSCGLVSMLAASLTNTLISSILFHMYIFIVTGVTSGIAYQSEVKVYGKKYNLI